MKKRVTIIIGDEYPSSTVTLQWPECRLLPSQYIPIVARHIKEQQHSIIRTCSSEIVNFVGAAVEYCDIDADVIYEGRSYDFDDKGCIEASWPFGALGWYDYDIFEIIKQ